MYISEKRCRKEPCHTAARPSEHEGAKKMDDLKKTIKSGRNHGKVQSKMFSRCYGAPH